MGRRTEISSRGASLGLILVTLVGCTESSVPSIPDVPSEPDPGTVVAVAQPLERLEAWNQRVEAARLQTADELREQHALRFEEDLGYDPLAAAELDRTLDGLVWDESQRASVEGRLARDGFAIVAEAYWPSFAQGYAEIYMNDLPVYVTADMVLEALHRSYSKIFQAIERQKLRPSLHHLLSSMRRELAASQKSYSPETASDLNFYLGVALSLLNQKVDSNEPDGVAAFVAAAQEAKGIEKRVLFGVEREIDFSQFTPRGHYAGDPMLSAYFRAMMWLGRIDFRLLETRFDGEQVLRRRQVEAALAVRDLVAAAAPDAHRALDATISAFVGEHDYFTIDDLGTLLESLGGPTTLEAVDDTSLAAALVSGELTQQRIASHVVRRTPGSETFPLNVSFALLGQRYTVDSHVLSNVVYDRVPTRVVPDPLDVAFGALRNDQALTLLGSELDDEAGFAGELGAIRTLIDAHHESYWEGSLYSAWLGALRSLSPAPGGGDTDLPAVARTEAWGRRVLNTQLASWAQLRHNNVLYVKQSYTSSAACEYPDAYVDPYPEFFWSVVRHAELAHSLVAGLGLDAALRSRIESVYAAVARTNTILAQMAEHQLTGTPNSQEHLAFINQAVTTSVNCDGTILGHTGWYADMHFEPLQAVESDPIITDVHTDIGGDLPVSRAPSVLHVGTHTPRPIIVTVDTCSGPRAYAGVVSLFQEVHEEGFVRLTDEAWSRGIYEKNHTPDWLRQALAQ